MYMKDWVARLDDFLSMAGNEVLDHAGTISHETMVTKAADEYEKFQAARKNDLSSAELDFIKHLESSESALTPHK